MTQHPSVADVTATWCATVVDEWVRGGVRHAVVAPGSRSTPMALALAARDDLELHVLHDERSAGFTALGLGLATGTPAIVLCTSGTAAAHLHAAVIEADLSRVPMLVCTADRPPELRDVGAAQTIDQTRLYGSVVRWYHDPGVPSIDTAGTWRSLAGRAYAAAVGPPTGPVHLNLPFREPLLGAVDNPPAGRDDGRVWYRRVAPVPVVDAAALDDLATQIDQPRGVIVAGRGAGDGVGALAAATTWPVLADPRSGWRVPGEATVAAFDGLLRHAGFAADHAPEVVVHVGEPVASKVVNQWIASSDAVQVRIGTEGPLDPDHRTAVRVLADPAAVCIGLAGRVRGATGTPWLARWRHAERRAQTIYDELLGPHAPLSEPAVARALTAALPDGAQLVVSSSMPVRDVEWYGVARAGLTVHANRGANGIDGVVATGLGVAAGTGAPTAVLLGDVAVLHDASSLTALARRPVDLLVVVIDNDGGGIFSFLPQAASLAPERFEALFGTPHGTDLVGLAAAHGLEAVRAEDTQSVRTAAMAPTTRVVVVTSDRGANVRVHDELHAAVAAALDGR